MEQKPAAGLGNGQISEFVQDDEVRPIQMLGKPTPDIIASVPNFMIWFGVTVIVALFILGVI